MFCQEWSLLRKQGHYIIAEPLRCKCWTCEECQPRRKAQLRALGRSGAPNTFLTLTVRPRPGESASQRAQALVQAFRTVIRRACRKYGYPSIPFLAVFERTKRGEPHLHVLARCKWIDQAWLSAQMGALIGAPIVDIRRVQGRRQMVNYVTKYIGKDPFVFKGCKRYWRSQNWITEAPEPLAFVLDGPSVYEVFRGSLEALQHDLRHHRYITELKGNVLYAVPWSYVTGSPPDKPPPRPEARCGR